MENVQGETTAQHNAYLGTESIRRLLLKFSVPCVLSMLVSALYNIVDQIFIGQGVGYLGNAATNVVYPFTVIALAVSLLIGDGSAALLSLSLGRRDAGVLSGCFKIAPPFCGGMSWFHDSMADCRRQPNFLH